MENIRNKAKLFSILTAIGISMVVAAYTTGVSEQLSGKFQTTIIAVVDGGNRTLNLTQNNEIIQSVKLPEGVAGVEYSYDEKNGKTTINYVTNEQLKRQIDARNEVVDKAIQIAESDKRVQQLITGKEYSIPMSGIMRDQEGVVAKMVIVIGNKNYEVIVNLSSEKVVAVEEVKELNNSFNISYSSNGNGTVDMFKVK